MFDLNHAHFEAVGNMVKLFHVRMLCNAVVVDTCSCIGFKRHMWSLVIALLLLKYCFVDKGFG